MAKPGALHLYEFARRRFCRISFLIMWFESGRKGVCFGLAVVFFLDWDFLEGEEFPQKKYKHNGVEFLIINHAGGRSVLCVSLLFFGFLIVMRNHAHVMIVKKNYSIKISFSFCKLQSTFFVIFQRPSLLTGSTVGFVRGSKLYNTL